MHRTRKDTNPDSPRNCRGYPGYFTLKGKRVYLRSTKEFIVATWLNTISHIERVDLEPIYDQYKPDFVIWSNGKPRTVIEVKDNKKAADEYIERYSAFFKNLGLRYIVIFSFKHFAKLTRETGLSDSGIQAWKDNSNYDYSGPNNPRFGMKATEDTKRKIGDKTIVRCEDPEYRKRISKGVSAAMNRPGVRESISERQYAYHASVNPVVEIPCDQCGTLVRVTKIKHENRVAKKGYFICSASCACTLLANRGSSRKFTKEESSGRFKTRLLELGRKILSGGFEIIDDEIADAKSSDFIYRRSPISVKVILEYFGSIENFKKEIMND